MLTSKLEDGFHVVTTTDNGRIISDIEMVRGGVREQITRYVIDTADAQVKQALVKLGWTPPKQDAVA